MVNGNSLRFRGAELVTVDARPEIEQVVPLSRFGGYCTAVCGGQKLTVKAMTGADAQYSIRRHAALRAYGPAVKEVEVNGRIVPFERDGNHVRFGAQTEVFVPTRHRVAARVQRDHGRFHTPGVGQNQDAKAGP